MSPNPNVRSTTCFGLWMFCLPIPYSSLVNQHVFLFKCMCACVWRYLFVFIFLLMSRFDPKAFVFCCFGGTVFFLLMSSFDPKAVFCSVSIERIDPKPSLRGSKPFFVILRILCCISFQPSWSTAIVDLALKHRAAFPCAVVGIDVAAGEVGDDPAQHAPAFQRAAGSTWETGAWNSWEAHGMEAHWREVGKLGLRLLGKPKAC